MTKDKCKEKRMCVYLGVAIKEIYMLSDYFSICAAPQWQQLDIVYVLPSMNYETIFEAILLCFQAVSILQIHSCRFLWIGCHCLE
jgi:hypothetical protein